MTPLIFDLIIVALILLSVALGFMRGFCNEVFTIFGWIAAIIATIYFFPVARDYGREMIDKKWLADLATSAAIFLGTLLVCSIISYFATKTLHATKLGPLDRALGFCFGLLRAVVLLGLAYTLFSYAFDTEDKRPRFVNEAQTKPFLEASANWMKAVLPIDTILNGDDAKKPPVDEKENTAEENPEPGQTLIPAEKDKKGEEEPVNFQSQIEQKIQNTVKDAVNDSIAKSLKQRQQ